MARSSRLPRGALRVGDELIAEDTERLREAIGGTVPRESITPLNFEEPIAPCVAARRLGFTLSPGVLGYLVNKLIRWWSERADVLVVEGIGGILCPVTEESTLVDLAIELDFPLVIVARRGLGTLNHTLLTVDSARLRGLRIAGIVLNASTPETNSPAEATNLEEVLAADPGRRPARGACSRPRDAFARRVEWRRLVLPGPAPARRFRVDVLPP